MRLIMWIAIVIVMVLFARMSFYLGYDYFTIVGDSREKISNFLTLTDARRYFWRAPRYFAANRSWMLDNSDTVTIGVVWTVSMKDDYLVEGVRLAVDKINSNGGLLGKKVSLIVLDDFAYKPNSIRLAHNLVHIPNLMAVIGHRFSDSAVPASIAYQEYGALYISPKALSNRLTQHGYDLVIRNSPTARDLGDAMVEFCTTYGFKRVMTVFERNDYGIELANSFQMEYAKYMENNEKFCESHAEHDDMAAVEEKARCGVVAQRSYFPVERDYRRLLSSLNESSFDAILVSSSILTGPEFIRQARQIGITKPIITGYALDSPKFFNDAGKAAEGTFVASFGNMDDRNFFQKEFLDKFSERYGHEPDLMAAIGYDSVLIIDEAVKKSKSLSPYIISSTLKFAQNWEGVMGPLDFLQSGNVVGRKIYIKMVKDGHFVTVGQTTPIDEERKKEK